MYVCMYVRISVCVCECVDWFCGLIFIQGSVRGKRVVSQLQGNKLNYNNRSSSRNRRLVVRASAKDIAFDQHSRAALQAGIDKLADAVGLTLGPRGTLSHLFFFWFQFHCGDMCLCRYLNVLFDLFRYLYVICILVSVGN